MRKVISISSVNIKEGGFYSVLQILRCTCFMVLNLLGKAWIPCKPLINNCRKSNVVAPHSSI